ncbi:MAG: aldehyde ferredoxin oxidoreductase N-terminal domain-containing protein [Candidatus Adiutricales bacterium]
MTELQGYAGEILRVDLSTGEINTVPTSIYADRFIGGRGVAAKIHWDEVPAGTGPFDPENRLVFMTGPVCGVPGFAGSRWQVSGKSALLNEFNYCNLGGSWGVQLKFAGYDGLVIHGKAENPVYLKVDDRKVELKDAGHLKGKGAIDSRERLKDELGKSFRVVAIGPAGENRVVFASILADEDASGSGGLGAVMGSKNLKAIVVRGSNKIEIPNKDSARELSRKIRDIKGRSNASTPYLPGAALTKEMCFGCIDGCARSKYTTEAGQTGKTLCHSGVYYTVRAMRYYGKMTEVPFVATKLCDDYGMDSYAVDNAMKWLVRGTKAGLFTDEETGIPVSKVGSQEFIETLTRKIAFREGLGDLIADGVRHAARSLGEKYEALITDYIARTGEMQVYDPRLYLTTGIFWAMEPRLPIQQLHELSRPIMIWAAKSMGQDYAGLSAEDNYVTSEVIRGIGKKFWGDEIAADFSTYDGKAQAAANTQNRYMLLESLILCDMSWPILTSPTTEDHVGDPTLGGQVLSVVTGVEYDEARIEESAQRIFTTQRACQLKDGRNGREDDSLEEFHFTTGLKTDFGNPACIVPGQDGEVFSRKGMTLDRAAFEKMKDEYYAIRGWDVKTGLPTREGLEALDLKEVTEGLDKLGKVRDTVD